MKIYHRVRGIFILLPVVVALVFFTLFPAPSPAAPSVSWTPSSVAQDVSPGGTETVSVSFTASESLDGVIVRVVPELEPYVQAIPQSFGDIAKGETHELSLSISAPTDATIGSFEGTVQLRKESNPPKNYAKPLPMTVNVVEGGGGVKKEQITKGEITITFDIPEEWVLSQQTVRSYIYSPVSIERINNRDLVIPPDISISIIDNPANMTLSDFISTDADGWYDRYAERTTTLIDGHETIIVSDATATPPHSPTLAAFVSINNFIIAIVAEEHNEQEFNLLLTSLSFI